MNHPYPSRAQLRRESDAERLLTEQRAATEAYHRWVGRALEDLRKLNFPLGSPSKHFDIADIEGTLTDSLQPNDNEWLELAAETLAEKMEGV